MRVMAAAPASNLNSSQGLSGVQFVSGHALGMAW